MDKVSNTLSYLNIDLKNSTARLIAFPDQPHQTLYPGAHIATGENGLGHVFHHGIVLDTKGEMEVAHFWGSDKKDARIQTTTLTCFLAGDPDSVGRVSRPLYLLSYDDDNENKRRETIARARKILQKADTINFSLFWSNCECFAAYCRKGVWISEQVLKSFEALIQACIQSPREYSTGLLKTIKHK
jgi:hypothetical protein